jgi:DNA-binding response OmpR family regulator
VVCQLKDCTPTNLPDRIRKLVADKSQAEDSKKLREENAALHLELDTLISENQAARKQGEPALAEAERIRMFAHQAGEVVAKAELFDEKVGVGSKPSGTRIAMILTDYVEKIERILVDMREVVNNVTHLRSHSE